MPDFLTSPFANGPHVTPQDVLVRLLAALLLGGMVAWIWKARWAPFSMPISRSAN